MARFYADIRGNRGSASRMGSADSGIRGHVRGWSLGGEVECHAQDTKEERDWTHLTLTGGSKGYWRREVARAQELPFGVIRVELFAPFGSGVVFLDRGGDPANPEDVARALVEIGEREAV